MARRCFSYIRPICRSANLAPVAKSLLERGGFKVNMVSMDWQSLVARRAKKDPSDQGGWSAFLTSWNAADITNPVSAAYFAANCDKGPPGWPCDAKMEELRDKFAKEADPAKQKDIAEAVQVHAMEVGTHVHLGQCEAHRISQGKLAACGLLRFCFLAHKESGSLID